MLDGMTLLLPLAVLALLALFPFVGCGEFLGAGGPSPVPPPTGSGTGTGTGPGVVTEPGTGTPTTPSLPKPPQPPPPATILELRLHPDINEFSGLPPDTTKDGVEKVVATWTLSRATALPTDPAPQPLEATLVLVQGTALFIDPTNSLPAVRYLISEQLQLYDRVTCQCVVTTRPIAGGGSKPPITVAATTFALAANQRHIVQVEPDWTTPDAYLREFSLATLTSVPGVGPVVPTRLQLNPSKDPATHINLLKPPPAPQYKVTQVKVTWTLMKAGGGPVDQTLVETIVRTDASRPFLEPDGTPPDPPAMWDLTAEQLTVYDTVVCQCVATMRSTNLADPYPVDSPLTLPLSVAIKAQTNHVLELLPDWTQVDATPRRFTLRIQI